MDSKIIYDEIKVTRGIDPGPTFSRDLKVLTSFSVDKFSSLLTHVLGLYLSDEPIDAETFKKWIKKFGDTEARVNSVTNLSLFLLRKAVRFELTKEDFENDLDKLGLVSHKEPLINAFNQFQDKIKLKVDQTKYSFNNEVKGCEWRLDKTIKVSAGQSYDEEPIAFINFLYDKSNGDQKEITFESDMKTLKAIIKNLENCLNEGEKWATKK